MRAVAQKRRLPVGAELLPGGGVHFRVWAPRRQQVEVVFTAGPPVELKSDGNGYFSGTVPQAAAGSLYRYRLDGGDAFPDPASRFQPEGPHGPSQVIDPNAFVWSDDDWRGVQLPGQVIYEMHLGTFTPEGTWKAAVRQLPELAELGITLLEIMPVNDFAGRFGWGYDGVNLFAPTRLYGSPDEMREFVNEAHRLGLGVILDVVYNHLGPDGNYLAQFAAEYFSERHKTDWGPALNFDGPGSGPVRKFYIANAGYWIDEFHLDGLRIDATQDIHDDSPEHIVAALTRRVRAAARGRETLVVGENEPQHVRLLRPPEDGGFGLDALWNDDFHHTAHVALTGRREAYYTDYLGSPQEFISAAKRGYLYQGQYYAWQKKRRGTPTFGISPAAFVTFLDNHDQVANSCQGKRCHEITSPGLYRALTTLMLLGPGTPMLFHGQEFASSSPFLYFADHPPELAQLVSRGRTEFLTQFPSLAQPEVRACFPNPADLATFERCKLDFTERETHAKDYALHRDLLKLRRDDPVLRTQGQAPASLDGAVLGPEAFVLRFFSGDGNDRLLLVNLGRDLHLEVSPEPLLAPVEGMEWDILWSSESPRYGADGTPPLESAQLHWRLPGESAVVLWPKAREE